MHALRERTALSIVLGLGLALPVIAAVAAVARVVPAARVAAWLVGGVVVIATSAAALRLRTRFPGSLDGSARRHPVRAGLWCLLALVALLQLGRLSAFMADRENTFGSAFPDPNLTSHICMSAYVQAAALARDGDPNIYAERHWPAFALKHGELSRGGPLLADASVKIGWFVDL
jgi:hypothetical protein